MAPVPRPPLLNISDEKEKKQSHIPSPLSWNENRPELTDFAPPSKRKRNNISCHASLLHKPSLRHKKRKFLKATKATSTTVSLCKHLTEMKERDSATKVARPNDQLSEIKREREHKEKSTIERFFYGNESSRSWVIKGRKFQT